MALDFAGVNAWLSTALLSVIGLRSPAPMEVRHHVPPAAAELPASGSDVARAVLRKLKSDRYLQAPNLEVTNRNGIVELRGTVPVSSWRTRAARVASVVRGVRGVVNRIAVVAERRADAAIASDVRRWLRATAALANMPITVQVEDGVVVLGGVIGTWEQQQLAERVALGVAGVRFCQNQLTSNTRRKRTAAMVAGDIRSRMDWDPLVQQASVDVSVHRGRVVLKGVVGGPAERRRVITHGWVKGVVAVDARGLVVDDSKRPDNDVRLRFPTDAEIAATLRDLLPFWPSIAAANLSTSVLAGVVTIRGTVQTRAEKRAAEDMVRSAVGVVAINTELRGPWWTPPARVAPRPIKRPRRAPRGR